MAEKLSSYLWNMGSVCSGHLDQVHKVPSYAAGYADPEVADYRIEKDIKALEHAVLCDKWHVVRTLLYNAELATLCGDRGIVHIAVNKGDFDMVELLLTRFSVNVKDEEGYSLLLRACQIRYKRSSHHKIIALLLMRGADTKPTTPLSIFTACESPLAITVGMITHAPLPKISTPHGQ